MVLHGIAWYCMVLHGIALYCMVLHGIAWFYLELVVVVVVFYLSDMGETDT